MHAWILNHDDSRVFLILYIGLAVVLSIWISLFWLVAVVAVHAAFEIVCERENDRTRTSALLARVIWNLKLDIALIFFALALGVYMDVAMGVVGLSAAGRAGVQGGARFAAWQNVLRGFLLSADDAAQVARAVMASKKKKDHPLALDAVDTRLAIWGGWRRPWTRGDKISLAFGALSILLILSAPLLSAELSPYDVVAALGQDLHPWP